MCRPLPPNLKTDKILLNIKGKGRPLYRYWGSVQVLRLCTGTEALYRYSGSVQAVRPTGGVHLHSSTLSLTSAPHVGGWSTPRPGRFTHGKVTRYPLYRRLGRPQGRSGQVRKISTYTGIRSQDSPARSESLYRLSYPGTEEPKYKL